MYDELVKRLRECTAEQNGEKTLWHQAADVIESTSKAYQMMAEAYEAEVTRPKWIPVTERLPEEDGCYLVAVKNDHKRRYSKTAWFSHDSWFARQDVTHWMPLPQPPKEEET